jgi:hypothetical protein
MFKFLLSIISKSSVEFLQPKLHPRENPEVNVVLYFLR